MEGKAITQQFVTFGFVIDAMMQLFVFLPNLQGPLPRDDVVRDYLRLCVRYDNPIPNPKYVVQQMLQVTFTMRFVFTSFTV